MAVMLSGFLLFGIPVVQLFAAATKPIAGSSVSSPLFRYRVRFQFRYSATKSVFSSVIPLQSPFSSPRFRYKVRFQFRYSATKSVFKSEIPLQSPF